MKFITGLIACLILLFATTVLVQAAPDATCRVPSTKYATIASAVSAAKCATILIAAGTYHEHDLHVDHDMTIQGAGASTLIDGDSEPILYVGFPTTTFALSDVTLQNAATNGGALALDTDVTATVSSVTFKNNSIGLWMEGGTLELTKSKFIGNNNPLDTGAAFFRDGNGGDVTITSTKFKKNRSSCAAAIYSATDSGTAQLLITNSQFIKNRSNGPGCLGGAIYTHDPMTISASKFSGNTASMATSWGGAIYQTGSGLSIDSTTFSSNSAAQGGALTSNGGINLTITYSTFDNNIATVGNGGGLYSSSPTVMINNTFYNNQAQGSGVGGGVAFFAATAYMSFVTLSNNTASSGGNLLLSDAVVYLKSSLLNQDGPANCLVNNSDLTSKGSNLSSDASCATYFTQARDKNNTDPLLDILANNGGPTKTQALLPGSPAINKSKNCLNAGGTPVIGDQRGVPRPQGRKCDIGAYEKD